MKKSGAKRSIRNLVLMAGFSFILTAHAHSENMAFPFFDQIVFYDPDKEEVTYSPPIAPLVLNSFHSTPEGLWIIPRNSKGLSFYNFKEETLISKKIQNPGTALIFFPYYFTQNREFKKNEGFHWTIHRMDNIKTSPLEGDLDIFISQGIGVPGKILLSGTNKAETFDGVYALSTDTGKGSWILKNNKEPGFLKMVRAENNLYIYYSSPVNGRDSNRLWIMDLAQMTTREIPISLPEDLLFYGPGFVLNKILYIPAINIEKKIFLVPFDMEENLKIKKIINAPTGVYTILNSTPGSIAFLGYNWFQARGDFWLVLFQPEKSIALKAIPLKIRNSALNH